MRRIKLVDIYLLNLNKNDISSNYCHLTYVIRVSYATNQDFCLRIKDKSYGGRKFFKPC